MNIQNKIAELQSDVITISSDIVALEAQLESAQQSVIDKTLKLQNKIQALNQKQNKIDVLAEYIGL